MIKTNVKDNGFQGILLPGDGSKNKVAIVMSDWNGLGISGENLICSACAS